MKWFSLSRLLSIVFCFCLLALTGATITRADGIDLKDFQPKVYAGDSDKYFQGIINLVFVAAISLFALRGAFLD